MGALASENYQIQKYTKDKSEYYQSSRGKWADELTTESESDEENKNDNSNSPDHNRKNTKEGALASSSRTISSSE